MKNITIHSDSDQLNTWVNDCFDSKQLTQFLEGPGIKKLNLTFDINKLQRAFYELLKSQKIDQETFRTLLLNQKPGKKPLTKTDLSGRYYLLSNTEDKEEIWEDLVDETLYSKIRDFIRKTYLEEVLNTLKGKFNIGRVRLLQINTQFCSLWHRDPEPRLHIPIITNPGALFVVNHHCTHLPADGSVYYTDTRQYHSAVNGTCNPRVHLVATLPDFTERI